MYLLHVWVGLRAEARASVPCTYERPAAGLLGELELGARTVAAEPHGRSSHDEAHW